MQKPYSRREENLAQTGPRDLRDPRSREYAIQTVNHLRRLLEGVKIDTAKIEEEFQIINQYEHWKALGYKSKKEMMEVELGDLSTVGKKNLERVSRSEQARRMKADNPDMSNAEIARELGMTRQLVSYARKSKNPVLAQKPLTPKPPMIRLTLDPSLTAANIRAKMGEEYAAKLKAAL